MYIGSLGNSTNSAAKLGALETGLATLHWEGMTNILMEVDSMLIMKTVRKLQNNTIVGKI
jgi:ribonuclease HI